MAIFIFPFFSEQDELYEFKCAMRTGFDVLVVKENNLSSEVPHVVSALSDVLLS